MHWFFTIKLFTRLKIRLCVETSGKPKTAILQHASLGVFWWAGGGLPHIKGGTGSKIHGIWHRDRQTTSPHSGWCPTADQEFEDQISKE
jgi:hypothetical protein